MVSLNLLALSAICCGFGKSATSGKVHYCSKSSPSVIVSLTVDLCNPKSNKELALVWYFHVARYSGLRDHNQYQEKRS